LKYHKNKKAMSKIRYLYIDDEATNIVTSIAEALSTDRVAVTISHPKEWPTQVNDLVQNPFDGLILDLRLDLDKTNGVPYRGLSLAQEIRTRATETYSELDLPLVLCSADERILQSFASDQTGHNLFDEKFIKTKIDYSQSANILHDLAVSYQKLKEPQTTFEALLNYDTSTLDVRLTNYYDDLLSQQAPVHEVARFILNEIVKKKGVLINEQVLATRLGVDSSNSEDWDSLKEQFVDAAYNGVFSGAWKRWWMQEIESWWENNISDIQRLRTITAEEKIEVLKEKTGLTGIEAIQPIKKYFGKKFWTVCKGTSRPIDMSDAILIAGQDNLFPWQENEYVSSEEAVLKTNVAAWKQIHPFERANVENVKKRYEHD